MPHSRTATIKFTTVQIVRSRSWTIRLC